MFSPSVSIPRRAFGFVFLSALAAGIYLCTSSASAQAPFPNKPVTLLVGYAAGGPVDTAARIIQTALQKQLGQPVIIDNRGGASGMLAATAVRRAPADGYTLFFAASATQTMAPHVQKSTQYDPLKDYTPIGMAVNSPNVLLINKDVPVKSLAELIAYARANPGKVTFGSAGLGSGNHFAGELLKKISGAPMLHVPYKGNAPAMADVMAGNITFMIDAVSTGAVAASGKRVTPLAVTASARQPLLRDVPTAAEAGMPDLLVGSFYALEGPPNLPQDIVLRLNKALRDALAEPDVVRRLTEAGYEITPSSPEELAARVKADYDKWGRVAQGLKFE